MAKTIQINGDNFCKIAILKSQLYPFNFLNITQVVLVRVSLGGFKLPSGATTSQLIFILYFTSMACMWHQSAPKIIKSKTYRLRDSLL